MSGAPAARLLGIQLGDRVVMKKPHPCGGNAWEVVRLGADIGLRCEGCGRRVLLSRQDLARRVKCVRRGDAASQ